MGIEDLRTLKTVGKVVAKNADEAATAAKVVDKAADVIVEMKGIEYTFPPGTDPVLARRIVWTKVMKPQVQGQEVKITLPSTLDPERLALVQREIDTLTAEKAQARLNGDMGKLQELNDRQQFLLNAVSESSDKQTKVEWENLIKKSREYYSKPKADVIPIKPKTEPKKLEPGIYEDTDTGKYFKIDKDGNMTEYNQDETP